MKKFFLIPSFAFCLCGCAAAGNGSDAVQEPLTWPPGQYLLEASVTHRQDYEGGERTVQAEYTADLDIRADGFMQLISASGLCRDPLPKEMLEDRGRWQRTFLCEDGTYVLKPSEETIRGELRVRVISQHREERCVRYSDDGSCIESEFFVNSRGTDKNLRLKVLRK